MANKGELMTRSEIVQQIYEEIQIQKKDIDQIIVLLEKGIIDNLIKGETIFFRGFGTFGTKIRKERKARNIRTNESILVPEHRVPYFQPGKELKEIKSQSKKQNLNR